MKPVGGEAETVTGTGVFRVSAVPAWGEVMDTVGLALVTVIVTSSVAESEPSVAVRRRTYVPCLLKVAVVMADDGLAKVTVPACPPVVGPLTLLQETERVEFRGRASSVAVPWRETDCGRATDLSEPAETVGARLVGTRVVKVAVTDLLPFIVTVVGLVVPLASPDQPLKVYPLSGVAVKVTDPPLV